MQFDNTSQSALASTYNLFSIADRNIGGSVVATANARALHEYLEVGRDFSNWIKSRIEQYGFTEGQDYVLARMSEQLSSGTKHLIEYHITIDMAKELAMVERNDKGKQARQYFIECERRAKAPDLNDPSFLRKALLEYAEKSLELEAEIEEKTEQLQIAAPKIEFHDAVNDATNCYTMAEAAKVLGSGQNRLYRSLRGSNVLMRNNVPYQQYLNLGYFKVTVTHRPDMFGDIHIDTKTLVTGKGLAWLLRSMSKAA